MAFALFLQRTMLLIKIPDIIYKVILSFTTFVLITLSLE
jgi:hypothetical protein